MWSLKSVEKADKREDIGEARTQWNLWNWAWTNENLLEPRLISHYLKLSTLAMGCSAGESGAYHHGAKHSSGLKDREIGGEAPAPTGAPHQSCELTEKLTWAATESHDLHRPLKHITKMEAALILPSKSPTVCLLWST